MMLCTQVPQMAFTSSASADLRGRFGFTTGQVQTPKSQLRPPPHAVPQAPPPVP